MGNLFGFTKVQAMGRADRHTSGFQACIDTVFTMVAFDYFARFRVPLRSSPRTGGHAGLAPDAQVFIYENDPVFGPFLHGTGGAGCYTPGILAMKAGHKSIRGFGQFPYKLGSDGHDLAYFGTNR